MLRCVLIVFALQGLIKACYASWDLDLLILAGFDSCLRSLLSLAYISKGELLGSVLIDTSNHILRLGAGTTRSNL